MILLGALPDTRRRAGKKRVVNLLTPVSILMLSRRLMATMTPKLIRIRAGTCTKSDLWSIPCSTARPSRPIEISSTGPASAPRGITMSKSADTPPSTSRRGRSSASLRPDVARKPLPPSAQAVPAATARIPTPTRVLLTLYPCRAVRAPYMLSPELCECPIHLRPHLEGARIRDHGYSTLPRPVSTGGTRSRRGRTS